MGLESHAQPFPEHGRQLRERIVEPRRPAEHLQQLACSTSPTPVADAQRPQRPVRQRQQPGHLQTRHRGPVRLHHRCFDCPPAAWERASARSFCTSGRTRATIRCRRRGWSLRSICKPSTAQRNVAAVYYQFNIPLLSNLTFSQSSRYDHYSDFGSAFSPRFALSFKPVTGLNTYISYSRGFRAPRWRRLRWKRQPASNRPPIRILHPQQAIGRAGGGGRQSRPCAPNTRRTTTSVWSGSHRRNAALGVDLYRIAIHDVIGTPNIQALIDANDPAIVVRAAKVRSSTST